MNAAHRLILSSFLFSFLGHPAFAEEKNGLMVNVEKKVLDKADERGGYYTYDRVNRTMGLKVVVKNMSFRVQPESEIEWKIIMRGGYYSSSSSPEGYTGKEKLKTLKGSEAVTLILGAVQLTGYADTAKAKNMEWQIVIRQDDKEVYSNASCANFEALAKVAGRTRSITSGTTTGFIRQDSDKGDAKTDKTDKTDKSADKTDKPRPAPTRPEKTPSDEPPAATTKTPSKPLNLFDPPPRGPTSAPAPKPAEPAAPVNAPPLVPLEDAPPLLPPGEKPAPAKPAAKPAPPTPADAFFATPPKAATPAPAKK